jgi:hypothetical protein
MKIQLRDRIEIQEEPKILCQFTTKPPKCCVECKRKTLCVYGGNCSKCRSNNFDYNGFACASYYEINN